MVSSFLRVPPLRLLTGWSEPVPGMSCAPLMSSAFSWRTVMPAISGRGWLRVSFQRNPNTLSSCREPSRWATGYSPMVNRTGYTRIAKPTSGINRENESSAVRSRVFCTTPATAGLTITTRVKRSDHLTRGPNRNALLGFRCGQPSTCHRGWETTAKHSTA